MSLWVFQYSSVPLGAVTRADNREEDGRGQAKGSQTD